LVNAFARSTMKAGFGANLRHGRAKGSETGDRGVDAAVGLVLYRRDNDNQRPARAWLSRRASREVLWLGEARAGVTGKGGGRVKEDQAGGE
jgi:hypothetical protein